MRNVRKGIERGYRKSTIRKNLRWRKRAQNTTTRFYKASNSFLLNSVQNEHRRKMLAFFYDRVQPRTPLASNLDTRELSVNCLNFCQKTPQGTHLNKKSRRGKIYAVISFSCNKFITKSRKQSIQRL